MVIAMKISACATDAVRLGLALPHPRRRAALRGREERAEWFDLRSGRPCPAPRSALVRETWEFLSLRISAFVFGGFDIEEGALDVLSVQDLVSTGILVILVPAAPTACANLDHHARDVLANSQGLGPWSALVI